MKHITCLKGDASSPKVVFAAENNATVHMPGIGYGFADGTWDQIEPLLNSAIADRDILITVYDF